MCAEELKMHKAKTAVALLFAAVSSVLAAEVPDLTDSMEVMCNPNATRWTASQPMARAATSLGVCDGKIYVSGGDWDGNLGPCPIFAVDPYTGAYVKEFESGTESIDYFRTDSEGCLYAPSVDPREGNVNECNVARRNADGTWTAFKIAPYRWIADAYYGTHTWDVAFWKGKIFTAGYGIGVGPEKTTARLSDATPQINSLYRVYASQWGGTFQRYRRFYAFLPFEDDLFCYPLVYSGTASNDYNPIGTYGFEEWRYIESTGKFACTTNAFSNVTPGLSRSDLAFVADPAMDIQLWHPTAFKGRVLYIAGIPEMTIVPFALYTAQNVNHSVKATRVNLGSGVFPFDIFIHDGVATVLAAQYDSTAKKAVNSVWESTDGILFTKKFTFSGVQYANAIAWCDGAYFVAMGAREAVKNAWTFTGTDEVGKIYRIRDPAYADAIQVVAENAEVSVPEGGTAVARFKLAAKPAASVTAAVRVSGGVPAVSADVASVTFTTQDWNQWHEVPLAAEEDNLDSEIPSMLVCGAGDPAALRAASVTVTPVNNDIFVPLTTADSGAVATNSATHAQYGANGAFDDNRSDTNGRWLSTKADHMFVVWKFNEATAVNMLRVWNGSDSAGGYASASRAPKAWTFSGSNDGENWTALDTRSNETGWSASGESRMYSFGNDKSYLYYKFDCTALNGASDYLQIWELEFYYVDGGSSGGGGSVGGETGGGSGGEGSGGTTEGPVVPDDGIVLYDRLMICGTANTQGSGVHILTDYVPKSNSVVRAKYASGSAASSNNNQFLFCSRKGSDNNKVEMKHFSFAPNVGGKFRFDYFGTQHGASATFTAGADYELEVKDGCATVTNVTSGGAATRLGSGLKSFETTYRLALFQSYLVDTSGEPGSWSNSFRGTFYYLKIYELEGGVEVLKHHFVPCTSNGVAAVCDIADARRVYVPVETSSGCATVEGATALVADVPEPAFGGAGVPAPALGVDSASGAPVFSFAIGNAVKGMRYRVYRTGSLSEPFEPWGEVVTAGADGVLDFAVATEGAPSGFFKVVPAR